MLCGSILEYETKLVNLAGGKLVQREMQLQMEMQMQKLLCTSCSNCLNAGCSCDVYRDPLKGIFESRLKIQMINNQVGGVGVGGGGGGVRGGGHWA